MVSLCYSRWIRRGHLIGQLMIMVWRRRFLLQVEQLEKVLHGYKGSQGALGGRYAQVLIVEEGNVVPVVSPEMNNGDVW